MKRSLINASILGILGLGAVLPVSAQQVNTQTAEISLCAGEYTIPAGTMGNTDPVVMWGYALGVGDANGCQNTPTSPGPSILLPRNTENTPTVYDLQITLYNALPRNTSLVIPGLFKPMSPVLFTAPDGSTRVMSFDTEVAPGGNATYSYTGVTQGAYLYQSGTHQQVQVQMGLVGAIMSDVFTGTAARAAYPGFEYTDLYPLIYSEIDPVIHAGVVAGEYNTTDMKSTVNYAPKYFGLTMDTLTITNCPENSWCVQSTRQSTFEGTASAGLVVNNDAAPFFRLFNGSTRIHTPTLIGANFDVVAEDGNLYPNPRRQYAVALAPLKTKDAIMDTSEMGADGGVIKIIDSAMNLSNPAPGVGGFVQGQADNDTIANGEATVYAEVKVKPSANHTYEAFTAGSSPVARRDETTVLEGMSMSINVIANDDLNGASIESVNAPKHGTIVATATGFDYTHDGSEGDTDAFLYRLVKTGEPSSLAGVKIAVTQQNDAPVANDDSVSMKAGQTFEVRVLDNDTDAESKAGLRVTAVDDTDFAAFGSVSFVDKAVTIMASAATTAPVNVGYTIADGDGGTAMASISVTVTAGNGSGGEYTGGNNGTTDEGITTGLPPVATDDTFAVAEGATYTADLIRGVLANDIANGGSVQMDEFPEHGSIDMAEDGTFTYIHDGSEEDEDRFSYTVYNQWGSDTAEVKVVVAAKMDPPRAKTDRARVTAGQSVVIDVLDNDKDRDSEIRNARIEIVDGEGPSKGTVTIGADNKLTYTANADASGKDKFKYRLYDDITGEPSRKSARVTVRIR